MAKKIKITGEIGWDVTANDIERQVAFAKGEDLEVEMATPGGSVYEGLKIYNIFKNYAGNVKFRLAGLVASMGSYIALARGPENVSAEPNSIYMIHNPSAGAYGDYRVANKLFNILNGLSSHLAMVYAKAVNKTIPEIRKMFDDDTYIFGEDIVKQGFASEMLESEEAEPITDEEEKNGLIASAKMQVSEVMKKVKTQEMSAEDMEGMANLVMKLNNETPVKPHEEAAADNQETKKTKSEVKIMDLETFKAEHRGLYDKIVAAAKEEGLKTERARVANIMKAGAKLPPTAQNVIVESITNGDDVGTFQFNAICAMEAGKEVKAGTTEVKTTTAAAENDNQQTVITLPEKMTSEDELVAVSEQLARMVQ